MKLKLLLGAGVALTLLLPQGAFAQATPMGVVVAPNGACPSSQILNIGIGRPLYGTNQGALCISGNISASLGGTTPNGTDGQATSSLNSPVVAYNYGYNSATAKWDRQRLDASDNLDVNCMVGCSGGTLPPTFNANSSPITVTSTATLVAAASSTRQNLFLENEGTVAMRCGPVNTVTFAGGGTTTGGFLILGTAGSSVSLPTQSALYCITSSASGALSVVTTP